MFITPLSVVRCVEAFVVFDINARAYVFQHDFKL